MNGIKKQKHKDYFVRIADFNIGVYSFNITPSKKQSFTIPKTDDLDLYIKLSLAEMENAVEEINDEPFLNVIFMCIHRKISEWLPSQNAFVLHSACFDVDGVGVAFAAHSGTGKTTHMLKWQELLGDKMIIVNGDKPIVRFFDDEPETPYAYGTPWNGKERLGCNMRTPLRHICFIERSDTNFVEKMDKSDAIERIFNQVYMPKDPVAIMNTMTLIDRLLSCCQLWVIHCNMEPEAAKIAYNTIFNSEFGMRNSEL